MIKGFKIRLYPTKDQENMFYKHISACNFLYNHLLTMQEQRYKDGNKNLSDFQLMKYLTELKNDGEHGWLYDVSNVSLQQTCRDLTEAYKNFFKGNAKRPKYKSNKDSKIGFPSRSDYFYFKDNTVHIQKIGKVKYKTDYDIPKGKDQKFINPRISYNGKLWMLSFSMEVEPEKCQLTDKVLGIDLGIKNFVVAVFGDEVITIGNINKSKKMRDLDKRCRKLQKSICRKYEESRKHTGGYTKTNNIIKEEAKLRKLRNKITGIRQNHIHQTTNYLVSLKPKKVVMEDLNVEGMMKNMHLSKAIGEMGFYEFKRQMKYKCEKYGIEFVLADRWYPSSKTCSCCGSIKKDLTLKDRKFECPECGYVNDRDINAAINLSKYVACE